MARTLFTGFPGFLGSELVPRVLARSADERVVCLVQDKFAALARQRADEIMARDPAFAGRVELIAGDITRPDLGLADGAALAADTAEIYHLAAVYDLSVRRELAMKVNVEGTRHLLEFARACRGLRRLHYVSTCYVSGRFAGIFRETDLVKGQTFNNYYEETKYLAEVEVQEHMRQGLPTTIYRPAIVVGDSRSGATQKYDGPYFVIRWLLRQPYLAVMPVAGDPHRTRLNLVPRDFVVDAIAHLSAAPAAVGKVYQLADPEPLTVDEVLTAISRATGRFVLRVPLPTPVAKAAIRYVPGVYWLMEIPAAAVDYFVHPTYYDTSQARAGLGAAGIHVPPLRSYLNTLVDFVREHPEIGSAAMA